MTEIEIPTASRRSRDVSVCLFLLAFGTVCGLLLATAVETGVFAYGEYHASNGSAVLSQLTGDSIQPVINSAGPDHPAWLAFCGVFHRVAAAIGRPVTDVWLHATAVMLGVNLMLLFLILGRLRFRTTERLALVALLVSLGATVNWSIVVETHVLSPTSLMLASLLVLGNPALRPRGRSARAGDAITYGIAMALAASVTITNVMIGILAALPLAALRNGRIRKAGRIFSRRFPLMLTSGLVGIGLLALVNLVGWYLWKDPEMRQFLDVLGERRLVQLMEGSWWDSVLSLAWIAPPADAYSGPLDGFRSLDRGWSTVPAYASGFLVLLVVLLALRLADSRSIFIPAFALFGFGLHAIYGKSESFIFAPAYAWATVVAFGIVGRHCFGKRLVIVGFTTAATLLSINLTIWLLSVARLQEAGVELTPP
ncbi:MAG: hypothetical protein CMJ54_01635 [Planctomycetaceae bacterium]|nr:hypothetical protein [Planctomycetaceae bacterium]